MERFKTGMLARSTTGHDAGKVYVIIDVDDAYVYLADGRIRTLDKLKKKKKKHVQLICREYDITDATDVSIRRLLKIYSLEHPVMQAPSERALRDKVYSLEHPVMQAPSERALRGKV